jgi:hypothetical protein
VPSGDRWLFRDRECELFSPPAVQGWGIAEERIAEGGPASRVPWWAVTRSTPRGLREPRPAARGSRVQH